MPILKLQIDNESLLYFKIKKEKVTEEELENIKLDILKRIENVLDRDLKYFVKKKE